MRGLIAVAGAGALLSAGLGPASASVANRTDAAAPATRATSVPMAPCGIKSVAASLYIGANSAVYKVSAQTGAAASIAPGFDFRSPAGGDACGVAVDGAGNVLVASDGDVFAVAARTGTSFARSPGWRSTTPGTSWPPSPATPTSTAASG